MEGWNAGLGRIGFGLAVVAGLGLAVGSWVGSSGLSDDAIYGITAGVAVAVGVAGARIQPPDAEPVRRRRDVWLQLMWCVGGAFLLVATLAQSRAEQVVFLQLLVLCTYMGSLGPQVTTLVAAFRRRGPITFGSAWTIGAGWGFLYGLSAAAAVLLAMP